MSLRGEGAMLTPIIAILVGMPLNKHGVNIEKCFCLAGLGYWDIAHQ